MFHRYKEFTHLLNAFDFSIGVNAPTHKGGHILDLVLLHGLTITDLEVCENGFSDHKTVMFTVSCSAAAHSLISWPPFSAYYSHYQRLLFISFSWSDAIYLFSCDASVEELLSRFNSTCSNVLNAVAPFRTLQSKTCSEPWIDDSIRSLRQCCRRAERKWKKDRLHVSFEILKDTLIKYQKAVKKAKCWHLSDIINKNCSRPRLSSILLMLLSTHLPVLFLGFLLHHVKNFYYFLIVKLGIPVGDNSLVF